MFFYNSNPYSDLKVYERLYLICVILHVRKGVRIMIFMSKSYKLKFFFKFSKSYSFNFDTISKDVRSIDPLV